MSAKGFLIAAAIVAALTGIGAWDSAQVHPPVRHGMAESAAVCLVHCDRHDTPRPVPAAAPQPTPSSSSHSHPLLRMLGYHLVRHLFHPFRFHVLPWWLRG